MTYKVYVIGPTTGPLKIGITNNIERRRSILNVGNHQHLIVHYTHNTVSKDEAERIENELHYQFKEYHIKGEWFNLSNGQIPEVINYFDSLMKIPGICWAPEDWSLVRKGCDEFTPAVCKKARGALDLTTKELAEKTGLSLSTINNFEAGTSTPNIATIEIIKSTLEILGIKFIRDTSKKRT